jgi:deoxyribose-phosphate aldolase
MNTVEELAKMIDHSILHPTMTDEDLQKECEVAKKYNVASVCVKPYAVKQAKEFLTDTDVEVGCVIGFPHGNSSIEVKAFETKKAIDDGATEIDMVVNIGKVLGQQWEYVEEELKTIVSITKANNAILKVIFENDYLPEDSDKIRLCEICSKLKIDFVKTSSGFGFVKGPDGKYSYEGATEHDLKLMRKHSAPEVQVKAAGGVRTLDQLLKVKELGCTRSGATATIAMLEEARKRFAVE